MNAQGHNLFLHDVHPEVAEKREKDLQYYWDDLTSSQQAEFLSRAEFLVERGYILLETGEDVMTVAMRLMKSKMDEDFLKKWPELKPAELEMFRKVKRG